MPLNTGQVINSRYRITRLLGQGGFGAVYRAWDLNIEASCALKENLDTSPGAQKQFRREAVILANLQHPNLPRVRDHFLIPNQGQYLVMDFVKGEDLAQKLANTGGPLPENRVLPWIEQICDALTYLHTQNPPIIHRDIKPANIKITPQGKAILVDFGIAKVFDPKLKTTVGARAVTPGYSPHEQYGQGKTDARSDVYALGASLYNLLTCQEPVESIQRVINDPLVPAKQINSRISPPVAAAIHQAMQPDPVRRYQTAAGFKSSLVAVPPVPPVVATLPASHAPQPANPPRANVSWLPWAGFAAALVIVGLVIALIASANRKPVTVIVTETDAPEVAVVQPSDIPVLSPLPDTSTPLPPSPTETLIPTVSTLVIGSTQISPVDGMVMVYVPAGEFTMGSDEYDEEQPIHTVTLDAYWIDQTEVTNAMYAAFLNQMGNQSEDGVTWLDAGDEDVLITQSGGTWVPKSGYADHPVVEVTWYGAQAYCTWAGRRLPSEAEWEKAARSDDERVYPWGNDFDCRKGNFDDETVVDDYVVPGGEGCDGFNRTAPVGSFLNGASPYDLLDMAGNVWEWVADWYDLGYYASSPAENPQGPASGESRVLRGGSWRLNGYLLRAASRRGGIPVVTYIRLGFRCALSP